jgi:hypothetical protein
MWRKKGARRWGVRDSARSSVYINHHGANDARRLADKTDPCVTQRQERCWVLAASYSYVGQTTSWTDDRVTTESLTRRHDIPDFCLLVLNSRPKFVNNVANLLLKSLPSSVYSWVCRKQVGKTWTDFHEIWHRPVLLKFVDTWQFWLKPNNNNKRKVRLA